MASFGELLRECRQRGKLSQAKLGELIGSQLGMLGGYSAAAVSDWERGKSKINEDERLVLTSLIQVLYRHGGLKHSSDANLLLEAGNYRALDAQEKQSIFPAEPMNMSSDVQSHNFNVPLAKDLAWLINEYQRWVREAEQGPSPAWPRIGAAFLKKVLDYWTVSRLVAAVIWIWLWLLTWWLVLPSLRLPFMNREHAELVLKFYVVGTWVTPILIGLLANPRENIFWKQQKLASHYMTHLYTYQGAGIGFHLGYFSIFAVHLLAYFLHIHVALWFEWLETGILLLWGYFAARLVPYNLWRAYGRLALADGWIFFVFFLLGPFWAFFFYRVYSLFFTSIVGGLAVLIAITLLIFITAWRQSRSTFS